MTVLLTMWSDSIIYPLLAFSVFWVERWSIRTIVDGLSYAIVLYCSHYRIQHHSRFSNSVTLSNFSDNMNLIWTHQSLDKTFKLQLNFPTSAKISNFSKNFVSAFDLQKMKITEMVFLRRFFYLKFSWKSGHLWLLI